MYYLRKFNMHSEYQEYIADKDKLLPNVSYCDDMEDIHYNPLKVIEFEDPAVKAICVENWGGMIPGEITNLEAGRVTSFNKAFKSNTAITKFNEMRYFTALTTLHDTTTSYDEGQFLNCTNLREVTIPEAKITTFKGAFRGCRSLRNLDLTPTKIRTNITIRYAFLDCQSLTSVKIPGGTYANTWLYVFRACKSLETITIDGTANLNSINNYQYAFTNCSALTTVNGAITNIGHDISLQPAPLTLESILVFINGLKSGVTGKTITLKATNSSYTNPIQGVQQYEDMITSKGWTVTYA